MTLTIHTAAIRETLAELARTAEKAGDTANANALNQAAYQVARGVLSNIVEDYGDLLVPSKGDAGTVYRTSRYTCNCTAGRNGKPCWHSALHEGWQTAIERAGAYDSDEVEPAPGVLATIAAVNEAVNEMSDAEFDSLVAAREASDPYAGFLARPGEPWAPDYIAELWP
jgi:hypothetical protein